MGTVTYYLDTSILVALLTAEPFSERADTFLQSNSARLIVSDFAAAEFSSAVARRVRMREFTIEQAETALAGFDAWLARAVDRVEIGTGDVSLATTYIRRLDFPLRTPDALHIAIARRHTRHLRPRHAARALGMAVTMP